VLLSSQVSYSFKRRTVRRRAFQFRNGDSNGTGRQAAIDAFGAGGTAGRVAALRSVTDANVVTNAEFNAAFVLMQYYGYLRRNPTDPPDGNDSGYQFWLGKLNSLTVTLFGQRWSRLLLSLMNIGIASAHERVLLPPVQTYQVPAQTIC
jgi:hypothetical protein